ncbi:MAG: hypothetical protein ACJ749_03710, partial [Flavisolibacter sp.]
PAVIQIKNQPLQNHLKRIDSIILRSNQIRLIPTQKAVLPGTDSSRNHLKDSASTQTLAASKQQLEQLFEKLKKPAQQFDVNPARDTTINCSEGTSIFIPANSFQTVDGLPVNGMIKISVQEFYNFSDIISNKLNTISNGEALVTAGMIHIEEKAGTQSVVVKTNSSLDLQMPTSKFEPQMQLFTGEIKTISQSEKTTDTLAVGAINWIPAGQKQLFYSNKLKTITILNLTNNPYQVLYRHQFNPSKSKSIAKFEIPWYCPYTTEGIRQRLEVKYGHYYDEIKVKRLRKPWSAKIRSLDTTAEPGIWYESPYVGDTVSIHIATATRLKFITREDSLVYESNWKRQLETAMKKNESYSGLLEMQDKYNFKINSLGWINCDRFKNFPRETLTDFVIAAGSEFKETYLHPILVFNSENVIMQGYTENNNIRFPRIPRGASVRFICIGVKDGKLITCIQNMIVGKDEIPKIKFSKTNPEEFKEKLRQLGTVDRRG